MKHRYLFRLGLVAIVVSSASCAINPVTGERELALVSEGQEVDMGRQAAQEIENSIGLVDNAEIQSYVAEVGSRLALSSERPDLPWEFHVVDDPVPNAFALPGGFVFVTRGLMTLLNSEAELAAVLGHEIGHVTARHSVAQISRAQLAQLGLGVGAILEPESIGQYGDLANTGLGLLFLKYGRDDERQADELGFRYMLEHDYDVHEMEDVFAALDAASAFAGQGQVPSWLSSHPSGPERIEALRERVAALGPQELSEYSNSSAYLRHIDGLVYGEDPRHGYFEGDTFYQPELAFKFQVPSSWQKRNTAAAVLAQSPDGEAALQLTIAASNAIDGAAREFLATEGVTELGTRSVRINGHTALVSEFSASTQSGSVHGLAAHIDYGQAVYRLIVFSPDERFAANTRLAESIVESFSPVTDPKVLGAKARRVRVVEVERTMSLEEFARRYPSDVSLDELALVNQVSSDARLSSGTTAKRIVG